MHPNLQLSLGKERLEGSQSDKLDGYFESRQYDGQCLLEGLFPLQQTFTFLPLPLDDLLLTPLSQLPFKILLQTFLFTI